MKNYLTGMTSCINSYLKCIDASEYTFNNMQNNVSHFIVGTKKGEIFKFVHFMNKKDLGTTHSWTIDVGEYYGKKIN